MNVLARPRIAFAPLSPDFRKFCDWSLVWVLLVNAPFMAMWFVGAPPRWLEIALAGFTGLIVKRMPRIIQWLAFVGIVTYSLLSFVAGLFNLGIGSLVFSLQFFFELKPGASAEYLGAGAVVVAILAFVWVWLKRDTNFEKPVNIVLAGALIFGLIGIDMGMGAGMRGHYFRAAPADALFESASEKSDFVAPAVAGKRHMLLVVVESLGVPRGNPAMQDKLFAYYNNPAIQQRYEVSRGTTLYYNSTTSGEVRELCGRWGDYYELVDKADKGCLPAQLAEQGYATRAVHSFVGGFFKRQDWYPHVGFQQTEFWEDLQKQGVEWCGGVFAGGCDRQVPPLLGDILKKADKPTFLYWLTLNAHLPVPTGLNLEVERCERVSPDLARDYPMICRQYAIFDAIDRALVKEITASDFPPTDILIVGDHMPPYYDRHHRSQFDPEHVPWLHLRYRGE